MAWIPEEKMVPCPNPDCSDSEHVPHMDWFRQGSPKKAGLCPNCWIRGPRIGDGSHAPSDAVAVRLWNQSFGVKVAD